MDFNLDELNPGVEFFFDDNNVSKGSVTLRVCPPDELTRIEKITDEVKVKYRRGQRHEYKVRDEKKFDLMLWDYTIVAWSGVTANKAPLECTAENKQRLMGGSAWFAGFVADRLEVLGEIQAKQDKAREKNLSSTQSDDSAD
jgi:hypothetical protein